MNRPLPPFMDAALTPTARELLDDTSFATVATLNADGSPQTSLVWVKRDGDAVLFSTTTGRLKARNLARDPRVSLTVFHPRNLYRKVEIRGRAELVPDPQKSLPPELSEKYGVESPPEPEDVIRLIVRVTPEKIVDFSV